MMQPKAIIPIQIRRMLVDFHGLTEFSGKIMRFTGDDFCLVKEYLVTGVETVFSKSRVSTFDVQLNGH